jgi:hypothetical protein
MTRYVDFDGTLAEDTGWKGYRHIGNPVPKMVAKVKKWLADGDKVIVNTARLTLTGDSPYNPANEGLDRAGVVTLIENWLEKNVGLALPITNEKRGYGYMYDDWGRHIVRNTGMTATELILERIEEYWLLADLDCEPYCKWILDKIAERVKELDTK